MLTANPTQAELWDEYDRAVAASSHGQLNQADWETVLDYRRALFERIYVGARDAQGERNRDDKD